MRQSIRQQRVQAGADRSEWEDQSEGFIDPPFAFQEVSGEARFCFRSTLSMSNPSLNISGGFIVYMFMG